MKNKIKVIFGFKANTNHKNVAISLMLSSGYLLSIFHSFVHEQNQPTLKMVQTIPNVS
jgi:hypothetical protein